MTRSPRVSSTLVVRPTLKHSIHDVVASFLLAALLVISAVVALLFAVWLLRATPRLPPQWVDFESSQGSTGAAPLSEYERSILAPDLEALGELKEPELEQALSQVAETAKLVAAQLDASDTIGPVAGEGTSRRLAGPGDNDGGDQNGVPVWERWELKFKAADIRSYAKQLDYFEIELGCVGGGIATVDSARDFSSGSKKTSQSPAEANKNDKMIFAWRKQNELAKFDLELLAQAGVRTEARTLLRFIPAKLEAKLTKLEIDYCQQNKEEMEKVYKTVFECKPQDKGFVWTVAAQLYRK